EVGEDAVATEEGEFAVRELAAQELVDCALLLGGDGVVASAFARVVAVSPPSGAPGSGLAGWQPAGAEAPVDGALWGVECLGDVRQGLAGLVAADGSGGGPGHRRLSARGRRAAGGGTGGPAGQPRRAEAG